MSSRSCVLFFLILISISPKCLSWPSWFSSSKESNCATDKPSSCTKDHSNGFAAKFSLESPKDMKALNRIENANNKLVASNSCWQNAYRHLFSGCSDIIATEEKRQRFAWHLSDCFQKDSGKTPFPYCDTESPTVDCLKRLNEHEHKVYLEFWLETNSICYQLQARAFKQETERLVNDLKSSAQYTEEKLFIIEEKSDLLLQNSNQIHDSLNLVNLRIENVAQTSNKVEDHMNVLSKHSEAVYHKSVEIAASQSELQEGQVMMNDRLKEGMNMLENAYSDLGQEVDSLKIEAMEIEKEIGKVGEAMSSRMQNLQEKADDIGNMTGISLEKQKELQEGQSTALEGLQALNKFQIEALEESRRTLQQLVEYSQKQQEELRKRQEQLQQVHDHLIESSQSILKAQEEFESKQARMFLALDKLFDLHNAMLLESRVIKAFLIYSMLILVIYMLTSTKQTYTVRPRLYIGLCATLLIEILIIRFTTTDIEQQTWIISRFRYIYLGLAAIQLLYAICTYRDYEVLNHKLLQSLIEKVNSIQRKEDLSWDKYSDDDEDINWSSWIDSELPEEIDSYEDPDYIVAEEVGENSIMTMAMTRYNLRHRHNG
ncbi:hypothetical protein HS088_TW03G00226 [Tripterygium wilfordii]|uniref:Protein GAMETE EXPRESSED 1 n=1 Tax=Tripterygium wilfordii TaxID=458696 RepID=A0A7J7DUD1_TRIWF|nr:protein GAMETE EXPRESSED 1 [Tripterygium wilfordii]KAF5749899.1 hypothetical protein HS088_TW03G00226 [Tripterygium wilfordii]